ncbi:DUF4124 domain-containing protein [Pseudomonas sp. 2FG]|uniref:DUF4124 domain-containing protein n=1 Tax=Pseudomonas sp. 2FG TaxID=2502191 RepID=UPI0010F559FE|nr:DUF4124 domain-containing protein [Pseudomonas sp. 2FG]
MRFFLLSLLLIGLPVAAEVYTYIDSEGNRVFTDRPKPGNAKRIELAPSNGMSASPAPPPPAPVQAAPAAPPAYQLLRILVPEPDATIRDGASGDLIVTATSEPSLLAGHNYRLLLDGQTVGEPSRSPVFPLSNLPRGTHQLAVEILDGNGRTLERTPTQPVHVLRISLEQKRRVKPCQKDEYGVRPECPLKDKPVEKKDVPYVPFI